MNDSVTVDLKGCARCWTETGHNELVFEPLTHPVEVEGEVAESLTHWALCPTNGEPILMGFKHREV